MPRETSEGERALLEQGAPLYLKALVAFRHFNAKVYENCHGALMRDLDRLGSSIEVSDLASRRIRPHVFPPVDPETDWDGTEAYIGAKIQIAPYAPLILFFYLGFDEEDNPAWWTGISLGFPSLARRTATLKRLLQTKNSLAAESSDSYGTDSWLLDFSRMRPLAEIDTFPGTLDEVVNEWIDNCQLAGGIKLFD